MTDFSSAQFFSPFFLVMVALIQRLLKRRRKSGRRSGCSKAEGVGVRLDGKTAVITGCNAGIGRETAMELSRRGARIAMACRDLEKADAVAAEIRASTAGSVRVYHLDLASLNSVRACAKEIRNEEARIDILVNNAGILTSRRKTTEDGLEIHMGTNHLGHFLLTNLLLDKMGANPDGARIVNVTSVMYKFASLDPDDDLVVGSGAAEASSLMCYSKSKLANILFTRELSRRTKAMSISCYAANPGVVSTGIHGYGLDKLGPLGPVVGPVLYPLASALFMKSPSEGARTSVFCAADADANAGAGAGAGAGCYFSKCREEELRPHAKDDVAAKELWQRSEKVVGI